MKKIIYLPLIALIALCSCKSNSFTTQRYTSYGHASHKKSNHQPEKVLVKATVPEKEIVETEIVKAAPVEAKTAKPESQNLICSATNTIKKTVLAYKPVRTKAADNVIASNDENVITTKSETKNLGSKKSLKEKLQNARGLIGSAFETALYIVLVVIFICLIIFLLSVIF